MGAASSMSRVTSRRSPRDSRQIVDAGYAITRVDAFDMFPNTPHVETVVVFDRAPNVLVIDRLQEAPGSRRRLQRPA